MTNAAWLAFLVAAAIGAPARYLIDGLVRDHTDGAFPFPPGPVTQTVAAMGPPGQSLASRSP